MAAGTNNASPDVGSGFRELVGGGSMKDSQVRRNAQWGRTGESVVDCPFTQFHKPKHVKPKTCCFKRRSDH